MLVISQHESAPGTSIVVCPECESRIDVEGDSLPLVCHSCRAPLPDMLDIEEDVEARKIHHLDTEIF
jgi:hypothetical protein